MAGRNSFAGDMASFKIYYEAELRHYQTRYCANCKLTSCAKCQYGRHMRELDENIRFCEREITRDQYDSLIAQRRSKYKNTRALCDTNIRVGDGSCSILNGTNSQRRRQKGILGCTKL